jgi:ATPases involved in chromosome partitioning
VSRLEVLGQPDFASSPRGVEPADFDRTMNLLREYYSMVVLDCGTALNSPLLQAALQDARAIVVVTNASIDALQDTDQTLEWLRYNGYQNLLDSLILVVNHTDPSRPNVVVDKVVEQFSRKIPRERIFITPFDRHIHEGREINLKLVSKKTRRRALEIAAAVSDMFPKNVD